MTEYQVCTSFSPRGYELYGQRFIRSFLEHWDEDVTLWVFHEGQKPPDRASPGRLRYVDLSLDEDFQRFRAYVAKENKLDHHVDYRRQPIRFAHKVFAYTHWWRLPDPATDAQWWLWVDADVETKAPVDRAWLHDLCKADRTLLYLGRDYPHSETGFIAWRVEFRAMQIMLAEIRRVYTSGELFKLNAWHDSEVFDHVRKQEGQEWSFGHCNLVPSGMTCHVWPHTVLGEKMEHAKGPVRKRRAYGAEQ